MVMGALLSGTTEIACGWEGVIRGGKRRRGSAELERGKGTFLRARGSPRILHPESTNSGAPNDGFLSESLKRYFRLSGVPLKLCRFILGCAVIFLSVRSF